ncbi:hypothetical protein, partial [uncultured Ruegeria sp.]|uniref:hypothetical protein n=1 Tax=uncultured Ruegeria sp. TaxID=259304 RepID=UPI0026070027
CQGAGHPSSGRLLLRPVVDFLTAVDTLTACAKITKTRGQRKTIYGQVEDITMRRHPQQSCSMPYPLALMRSASVV